MYTGKESLVDMLYPIQHLPRILCLYCQIGVSVARFLLASITKTCVKKAEINEAMRLMFDLESAVCSQKLNILCRKPTAVASLSKQNKKWDVGGAVRVSLSGIWLCLWGMGATGRRKENKWRRGGKMVVKVRGSGKERAGIIYQQSEHQQFGNSNSFRILTNFDCFVTNQCQLTNFTSAQSS